MIFINDTDPSTHAVWPAIEHESLEWRSRYASEQTPDLEHQSCSRRSYRAAVPPFIRGLTPRPSPRVAALATAAEHALVRFDAKLAERSILTPKNEYRLGQVWRTDDAPQALDRFAERAGRRG